MQNRNEKNATQLTKLERGSTGNIVNITPHGGFSEKEHAVPQFYSRMDHDNEDPRDDDQMCDALSDQDQKTLND